jgi:hypothetical protein
MNVKHMLSRVFESKTTNQNKIFIYQVSCTFSHFHNFTNSKTKKLHFTFYILHFTFYSFVNFTIHKSYHQQLILFEKIFLFFLISPSRF